MISFPMTQLIALEPLSLRRSEPASAWAFAGGLLALMAGAAILAGWLPVGFSIVTVFLFAGPHNWLEFRYFLTRLPGRWGKLRWFFLFAFAGVFSLTLAFALMPSLAGYLGQESWPTLTALWASLLVGWVVVLVQWRSRQNPRREWGWSVPAAFLLIALAWCWPSEWVLALVYLHPLMALWILDRELRRSRPQWRSAYHLCLCGLPLLVVLLWWRLADSPSLPGTDVLTVRITQHAGGDILHGVSTHLLVSTHTFLEMVHYGVWVLAIPLVGIRTLPWKLDTVPMARRSALWKWGLASVLAVGFVVVLFLWAAFLANYPLTRDVYFTVALLHVLAEVPFLLRSL